MNASSQTTPPARGPDPQTAAVTCAEAARLLVAASAADLETQDGGVVEAWTIDAADDIVHASGPRLQLSAGMQLWWRFLDEQGTPYRAEVHVLEAQFKSNSRAALVLQVTAVTTDRASRVHDRCRITGSASLTAVNCERVVDTDQLSATFHDLSVSGVALIVRDERVRPGDRFAFRTRFVEGTLDAHVRVARVSRRPATEDILVGAYFLDPSPQLVAVVERVIERFGTHRRPGVSHAIRDSLGMVPERPTPERIPRARAFGGLVPGPGMA